MKSSVPAEYRFTNFLHPRYWSTWAGLAVMYMLSILPLPTKMWLGKKLGLMMYRMGGNRLSITQTNIRACFPELTAEQQDDLIRKSFIENMRGLVVTTTAWWRDLTPALSSMEVHGLEHIKEAEARGKGVLMVGGHFSILDMAGPLVHDIIDGFNYMYRPHNNPLFDAVIERCRARYRKRKFTKFELKDMITYIKEGNTVWYGYDQDFGRRRSVFAPFFGIQTATLKAPMSIARDTGATVIMVSQFSEGNGKYSIHFSPILENFPGEDDDATAAARLNKQLESFIRIHPEQYLWMHRRFNSRPEGEEPFYPKKKRKKKKKAA